LTLTFSNLRLYPIERIAGSGPSGNYDMIGLMNGRCRYMPKLTAILVFILVNLALSSVPAFKVSRAAAGLLPEKGPNRLSPTEAAPAAVPIVTATTAPDGSIIHVVEQGQFLIDIADAYGISLIDLMTQNGLNANSVIYPGDTLVIQRANRTVTVMPNATETPSPTATIHLTRTPAPRTPTPAPTEAPPATSTILPTSQSNSDGLNVLGQDPLLVAIGILVLAGAGLILFGSVLKRQS
jgi:LysM repeat protein